jgi:hypothetical protein
LWKILCKPELANLSDGPKICQDERNCDSRGGFQTRPYKRATKLDEQMKAFGQWASWLSGKRGVSR